MDNRGVMGFPMRITLAVVLCSLCIPALMGVAEDYEERTCLNEIGSEMQKITASAVSVYYGGAGCNASVSIDVPAGYSLAIGGTDIDRYSMVILKGDVEVSRHYNETPAFRFLNEKLIVSGHTDLRLACENNGMYGVRVTVA